MENDMAALRAAKKELRAMMRQRLSQTSTEFLTQQSTIVKESLLSLPEYKSARRVGIYLSMPKGEVFTKAIVEDALQQGKQVYVPYLYKAQPQDQGKARSVMDMVSLHSNIDYEDMKPDAWGIPTPNKASIPERHRILDTQIDTNWDGTENVLSSNTDGARTLDVIVMPGVAFDKRLGRLGHGKGFYDYFLEQYKCKTFPMPVLVGLALDVQLLPDDQTVPLDASDWALDALVIGNGTVLRKSGDDCDV